MGNKFRKFDHINNVPDEILEYIFRFLTFHEVMPLWRVCKRWNQIIFSDQVWSRFLPKYPYLSLPEASTTIECCKLLWSKSFLIGKERWYPNPIRELNLHDEILQKARVIQHGIAAKACKTVLMIRLNPYYDFTKNSYHGQPERKLPVVDELVIAVDKIIKTFKEPDLCRYDNIHSAPDVLKRAGIWGKLRVKHEVLELLEPDWFVERYELEPHKTYNMDENGAYYSPRTEDRDVTNTVYSSSALNISEDGVEVSEREVKIKNKLEYSQTIGMLYGRIKNIFIDNSSHFIWLPLDNGCFSSNENYCQMVLVGDKAVIFQINFYI